MSSNPDNDPDLHNFMEFTSRIEGQIPTVAESNRERETKYRLAIAAGFIMALGFAVKLIILLDKLNLPEPQPVNVHNLTPTQQEALLQLHGLGDSTEKDENSKNDEQAE